jgi:hypothetical protein
MRIQVTADSVKKRTKQEASMICYLLHEISSVEQKKIEKRFLTDNRYFEKLCRIEDTLIDDYVQSMLTDDEREKAEIFLSSSRYQANKVSFVRNLIEDITLLSSGRPVFRHHDQIPIF